MGNTGVSTILPVWLRHPTPQQAADLRRAMASVLAQESPVPIELLVVDDGSEPPVRVPFDGDSRVRVLRLRAHRGIAYALNAGLAQARYDWIARIDADDVWRPGKLTAQLGMSAADAGLTLVAASMRLVHLNAPHLDRDERRGGDWAHAFQLTTRVGCPFPHGSILARRDVFELLGGYPQDTVYQHAEDFALWAQWLRFFKVAICDEVLLDYAISARQISARYQGEQAAAAGEAARILDVLPGRASIPAAIERLSTALGLGLFETSHRLFTAWKFHRHLLVDDGLYGDVCRVLPDRAIHRPADVPTVLAPTLHRIRRAVV